MEQHDLQAPGNKLRHAYDGLVSSGAIEADDEQIKLVSLLDTLLLRLSRQRLSSKSSALGWLFGKKEAQEPAIKGLYIWGDVGRGKSMLMDLFFENLPHKHRKRRVHFNDFMQDAQTLIHQQREAFKAGETTEKDPIPVVARNIAEQIQVLCFDEFTVTDIADAMILGRLFETLFNEGVIIIATSNVEPQNLYKDGLNRNLFLPFIDLLQTHVDVLQLGARTDFRLEKLNLAPVYLTPVNKGNQAIFSESWHRIAGTESGKPETIQLKGRELVIPLTGNGAARAGFDLLCLEPRSAEDYLAIARRFHTLFIEAIPVMHREDQNAAKRFILLIDTLYDSHTRLVAMADAPPDELYTATSGTVSFEFKRTISRLVEMQSIDYIGAQY